MFNNYNIALRRYKSLQRQLSRDPNLEVLHAKEMEKSIENGEPPRKNLKCTYSLTSEKWI